MNTTIMKYFSNSLLLIFFFLPWQESFGADPETPITVLEEQIRKLDVCNRRSLEDIPQLVSALEVINIPSRQNQYEGYGIKMAFTTGDMKLIGAKNFKVDHLSISDKDLRASIVVSVLQLKLTSDNYTLKGRAMFYPLSGKGIMNVNFQNATASLSMRLLPKGNTTEVKDLKFDFNVTGVKIQLQDSSWPINNVLNARALQILDDYRAQIVSYVENKMKESLNQYLRTLSIEQVLRLIDPVECLISRKKAVR